MNATDQELLERFQSTGDQPPFEELVRRHLGLVRATAFRIASTQMVAEEASQIVFTKLARSSALKPGVSLIAWLHRTTRTTALDLMRAEIRRGKRERIAASLTMNESYVPWERISPVLDQAIDGLSAEERHVVLCRYFEGQSHAEIARSLNVSEDALRMRVNRALEKIRVLLQRRGITTTASALAMVLPAHALGTPVSAGLVSSVTATALTSLAPSLGLLKIIGITMTKKSASIIAILLLVAGGIAVVTATKSKDSAASPSAGSSSGAGSSSAKEDNDSGDGTGFKSRVRPVAKKEGAEADAELVSKYGEARVKMASRLTTQMLHLMGEDGLMGVARVMNADNKDQNLSHLTSKINLTEPQQKTATASYDKVQTRREAAYQSAVAYLNTNSRNMTESLLAGDALKRGKISAEEYQQTSAKLDPKMTDLDGLMDMNSMGGRPQRPLRGAGLRGRIESGSGPRAVADARRADGGGSGSERGQAPEWEGSVHVVVLFLRRPQDPGGSGQVALDHGSDDRWHEEIHGWNEGDGLRQRGARWRRERREMRSPCPCAGAAPAPLFSTLPASMKALTDNLYRPHISQ
jgi:RNA polymerase sigma factor (sigma-70 family)